MIHGYLLHLSVLRPRLERRKRSGIGPRQADEKVDRERAAFELMQTNQLTLNSTRAGRNVILGLGLATAAANMELLLELVHC